MMEPEHKLIVTIQCITYNHEPFIRQCLEGFVMQKTNFRFEAIVHDDASTDGTAVIVKEYGEKYPDIIKPILETENQYSKHDGSLGRIMHAHTHGKYIALCEGDDYWTDPYKLQKQVDFLESHPDYSLCFHNAMVHFEDKGTKDHVFFDFIEREFKRTELVKKWMAPTASFVFRKEILETSMYHEVIRSKKILVGDFPLLITCSYSGKVWGMNGIMSVYRKHKGGVMNLLERVRSEMIIDQLIEFRRIFGSDLKAHFSKMIGNYAVVVISLIEKGNFSDAIQIWKKIFRYSPCHSVIFLCLAYPLKVYNYFIKIKM